jgi:hypothetical protein
MNRKNQCQSEPSVYKMAIPFCIFMLLWVTQVQANSTALTDWQLEKHCSPLSLYSRASDNRMLEVKAVFTAQASLTALVKVLDDTRAAKLWITNLTRCAFGKKKESVSYSIT